MKTITTLLLLLLAIRGAAADGTADGVPSRKGEHCTFVPTMRYSRLVIDSRINDFKANTTAAGFGKYDAKGATLEQPQGSSTTLDYVPGLVAKAILEAADYYKDRNEAEVAPWYYAILSYGNRCDITSNGKNGKSFDDLNAVKLYFKLSELASGGCFAEHPAYTQAATLATAQRRFADALSGIGKANKNYAIKAATLAEAAGGWWHKSSYTDQMWCDGQYMGPALLAQLINGYAGYSPLSEDDWSLIVSQFDISWRFLWSEDEALLYHAFTADPGGSAAQKWAGVSAKKGAEVYHSAEFWSRAIGWYFLALVDVLEQMGQAGRSTTADYATLHAHLQQLAAGIAKRQDAVSGCWYQLTAHDGTLVARSYNSSYSYTSQPVANYLESSATAIFTAAFLKGVRLGLIDEEYTDVARKAYQGFVEQFMVADGNGGVHLIGCCKSAGLGGSNYRDGSAEYYLMGKDTKPTSTSGSDFYTEGKVLGGFILAAIEYERLADSAATAVGKPAERSPKSAAAYTLGGRRQAEGARGISLKQGRAVVK